MQSRAFTPAQSAAGGAAQNGEGLRIAVTTTGCAPLKPGLQSARPRFVNLPPARNFKPGTLRPHIAF